ncbi:response regulator transcription factor [Rhodococcus qingshengii]|uniref:response regulator transcription factor n=1 Tax=Rhodococcus qingshengii TaxID=334542 RepID=UPI00211EEAFC|nr:LuxR C-terminal-related transcriptional regulator [Rhodococcus qingshengii]
MPVDNYMTNTALTPTSSLDAKRASLPPRPATPSHEATVMRLSKRQEQIIELVAEGYSGKEVARLLGMSPKTVESHLQRVFDRYGVRSRAGVVARWMQSKHLAAS